ncbi:WbqC family protein [Malaciobacter molluscorum LMG 25693]|uniref:WbqC family protein n=1 Tax=Malaciobacter molluscorum LMG 25693 TaxID=870501 RepID=A0AB33GWC9_9BACT|nr:WbqC family protein [Malaciobacter molluscorum]AXX93552.1 WbqC family protein [Malaciobacter molluscorum LMG 25693]
MKLAIMQPTFNPWIGYFDLIDYVDEFVFLDTVQLAKRSWQVRNKLKVNNKEYMFSLPIKKEKSRDETILKDVKLSFDNYDFSLKLNSLILRNYKKARYFSELEEKIFNILSYKTEYLCEYNINFIKEISKLLNINTNFSLSSNLKNIQGNKGDLILNICINKSCSEYISALGSKDYLYKYLKKFNMKNIDIVYQYYKHPIYNQVGENFIYQLGILDLLFNEGLESSKEIMLKGRYFIDC